MLFTYSNNRYKIIKYSYLSDFKIGGSVFGTFKIDNKLSPCMVTAIDSSKLIVYKKINQEYLERFRIGLNNKNTSNVKCLDVLKKQINIHSREVLGYGINEKYGMMDTTGTASGFCSSKIKQKALLELIEKNEAMLIWYLGRGFNVVKDEYVNHLINKIGFFSEELYIFSSKNICNYTTFVIFLFHDKKIIATGVSIDRNSEKALVGALLEAKLLESIFRDSMTSPYYLYTEKDYDIAYRRIIELSEKMKKINIKKNIEEEFILSSWITSIEFAILNTKPYEEYTTIRCFSSDLLNSIPLKENILHSLDRKIFKVFEMDKKFFSSIPDCAII